MPLILAIEPDRRQAAQLSAVVRKRVSAELILVDTTERALDAIGNRMPDLVLVPALLSPQDDAALAGALRVIAAAARVQMLTIPVLGSARPAPSTGGVLSALRRGKSRVVQPDGCDPSLFAEQIASYLEHAAEERANAGGDMMPDDSASWEASAASPDVADVPPVAEAAGGAGGDEVDGAVEAAEFLPRVEEIDDARHAGSNDREWLDAPVNDADPIAAAPDESVSIALEEAVRALFADEPAVALFADEPAADEPSIEPPAAKPPSEPPPPVAAAAVSARAADEWAAVEELMAALELLPLAAIDAFEEDVRTPPIVEEPEIVVEPPERVFEDPNGDDIDLTAELKDPARQAAAATAPARSEREWVALIESLRHDVERLRVERAEKPPQKPSAPPAARPAKAGKRAKPVQDEWGFFDPEQCGFAALLAKLDEVTEADEGRI